MNTPRTKNWYASACALVLAPTLHAAVNITAVPTPDPFTAIPAVADWSSLAVGTAGVTQTADDLDTKVKANTNAAAVITVLGSSATIPPSVQNIARFNTGVNTVPAGITFLQTRATGEEYLLLMAHLQNATGGPINAVNVAYDYSKASVDATTATEEIKGFRVYWSVTGTAGTWELIPGLSVDTTATYDAPQAMTAVINLPAPLADGGTMFLLWADQNSVVNQDASYHIKNFSASTGTPINCSIAGAVSNIVRGPGVNAADPSDDTVSFSATFTGTGDVSPAGWTTTAPASLVGTAGAYGVAHNFANLPVADFPTGTVVVKVADAATALCQTTVVATIPRVDVIGQYNLGGGLTNLLSDSATTPAAEWVNNAAARTLTMTAGLAADSVVTSQTLDLSAVGAVQFTGKLHLVETSTGSNLEIGDRFKAELIVDGVTHNLVTTWDVGDGSPSTTGTGLNGAPNGYINGYSGAIGSNVVSGTAYAAAIDDYNDNKGRDEFNLTAQGAIDLLDNTYNLSFSIPEAANSVQLKIYGAGFSGSETVTVSDVLFTTGGGGGNGDGDGDGVSDTNEGIMGTSPTDANDVLRLTQNPATPTQIQFPTKAGRFYRVYVSDDTDGQEANHLNIWKDAGLATISGDGTSKQFNITVAPTEKRRFYRLHVMQTDGAAGVWPATYP